MWSSWQGEEGSQASWTDVLGRVAVPEELRGNEGCRGRQGWVRLHRLLGSAQYSLPFFAG